jgi:CRP-like cAMP-binding protein
MPSLAAEQMTHTLTLVRPSQSPHAVSSSHIGTSPVAGGAAEKACELFFARIAPAGPVGADDRRAIIEAVVEILAVANDRPVLVRSKPSVHLHFLAEGWACRAQTLPNGARQITDVFLPGDFCGWAPSSSHDMGRNIRACGRARVALLRKIVVAGRELPAIERAREWARDVEARILRARLVSLGRRDARQRVAYFMSEVHDRLQQVGLTDGGVFTWPLTQEQLADVLGLTSVHVNRVLQGLRREGLVVLRKPRLFIPDLARLHAAAGFDDGWSGGLGD